MKRKPEPQSAEGKQGRMIALVIALAALAHLLAPFVLDALGLDLRYANFISLCAIAAFIWSFVAAWRIWQKRREE